MNNYHSLLNIRHKFLIFNYVIALIFILTLILMVLVFTYNSYSIMGVYNEGTIIINVPLENSDAVLKGNYLIINGKKYKYEVCYVSSLKESNYINYQEHYIKVNNTSFKQNEVIDITFYYKKQRVIKKLIEIIF